MSKGRFCYRCGAGPESGPFIEGLCARCFSEENPLIRAPGKTSVLSCGDCGAYRIGDVWRRPAGGDPVSEAIVNAAVSSVQVAVAGVKGVRTVPVSEARDVRLEAFPDTDRKRVRIVVRGRVHRLQPEATDEVTIDVRVETGTCEVCRARRGGKYEAIIQLRGDLDGRRISEARRILDETIGEFGPGAFVSKTVELKEGLDFYICHSGVARKATLRIKKLGADVRETSKLVGQERDGKRRYRSTFLVRFR